MECIYLDSYLSVHQSLGGSQDGPKSGLPGGPLEELVVSVGPWWVFVASIGPLWVWVLVVGLLASVPGALAGSWLLHLKCLLIEDTGEVLHRCDNYQIPLLKRKYYVHITKISKKFSIR